MGLDHHIYTLSANAFPYDKDDCTWRPFLDEVYESRVAGQGPPHEVKFSVEAESPEQAEEKIRAAAEKTGVDLSSLRAIEVCGEDSRLMK